MPNEKVREANIEKALKTGMECLMNEGIYNLQLKTVAEKSGLSKRSLLRYFGSKDAFALAVLNQANHEFFEEVRVIISSQGNPNDTAFEKAFKEMTALKETLRGRSKMVVALLEVEIYLLDHHMDMSSYEENYQGQITQIAALLEEGRKDGSMTKLPEDVSALAQYFCHGLWGVVGQMALMIRMGVAETDQAQKVVEKFIDNTLASLN